MGVFADVVSWGLAAGAAVCLTAAFVRIGRRNRAEADSHLRKR